MALEKKLSVQLLGQPLITWGGQTLTIPRKQARLILYFLACHKDMVSREDMTLIFWPDSPNPRQQLRDHLSKLRAELPDPKILKTDRDWICFDFDYVHSDVLTFEDNYDQVSLPFLTNEKRPLPEAIYQKILAAVNMWKSPQFMHGVGVLDSEDLNEWIVDKNRKLRIKWLSLMMRIAQHLMIIGDLEGALDWLEKVSEHDQDYLFPQVIYSRLEVLYQLGMLSRAYDFGQENLEQIETDWFAEYKLPFEALLQKIERDRHLSSLHELPPTRTATGMTVPLMGRKEVLNEMLRAFHRGNIILLSGETGMGKTRLMHEFVNRLTVPLSVLSMEAVYTERDIPFHPFIEMLRRSMNMNEWQKVENFWLAQLVPFFPELQNMVDRRFEVIGVIENKRLSLYESFRQVFLALIGQHKVLISLENAQWMDEESARLLGYLAQRQFFIENAHLVMLTNQDEARSFGLDY
ncbi:MAG TPA: AAA family ATPase, partial [Brevefilum sp.]